MIITGNAYEELKKLADKSVHCIVTSPPYFGLRSYGTNPVKWPAMSYTVLGFPVDIPEMTCELGHEPDPKAFIGHLVLIFREARRVLRDDGTCWINMGDSYAGYHGNSKKSDEDAPSNKPGYIENMRKSTVTSPKPRPSNPSTSTLQGSKTSQMNALRSHEAVQTPGIKPKDLIGIPWMMAYALRDDGWYLRQDIIWAKPNCMPESVTDRCTKSHEYVFMFSKSQKYFYDAEAIKTEAKESSIARVSQDTANQVGSPVPSKTNGQMKAVLKDLPEGQNNIRKVREKQRGHSRRHAGFNDRWDNMSKQEQMSVKANKRSVWTVSPAQYKEEHFAVFPEQLIWDMVKAGCPEEGIVLDMFFGRGTTGVVARKQNKNYIGIEMLPKNVHLAKKYLYEQLGFMANL